MPRVQLSVTLLRPSHFLCYSQSLLENFSKIRDLEKNRLVDQKENKYRYHQFVERIDKIKNQIRFLTNQEQLDLAKNEQRVLSLKISVGVFRFYFKNEYNKVKKC